MSDKIRYCLIPGSKFNRFTVLDREQINLKNDGKVYIRCKCDCNNVKIIPKVRLVSGHIKSCGCLQKERSKSFNRVAHNKLPLGQAALNLKYKQYVNTAHRKNRIFSLSKEDFFNITQKKCFYCGSSPTNTCKSNSFNGDFIYNGIDRVNSSRGYELDNCVPCCIDCNIMKHTKSIQRFLDKCIKIYNFTNNYIKNRERIWEYHEQE